MATSQSVVQPPKSLQPYRCFLLRCRLEPGARPGEQPAWRFTLQTVGDTASRCTFASVSDLETYLEAALQSSGKHRAGHTESTGGK